MCGRYGGTQHLHCCQLKRSFDMLAVVLHNTVLMLSPPLLLLLLLLHDHVLLLPAGKSREEVKATLKSERAKLPRRRLTHRRRTSRSAHSTAWLSTAQTGIAQLSRRVMQYGPVFSEQGRQPLFAGISWICPTCCGSQERQCHLVHSWSWWWL
jgi:hypothetical protein